MIGEKELGDVLLAVADASPADGVNALDAAVAAQESTRPMSYGSTTPIFPGSVTSTTWLEVRIASAHQAASDISPDAYRKVTSRLDARNTRSRRLMSAPGRRRASA